MHDPSAAAARVSVLIRSYRLDLSDEKETQRQIGELLTGAGLAFTREMRLSGRDIPDFFLAESGLAIEVKRRPGSKMEVFRQLERYAEDERVLGLLLVSNTAMGLPPLIKGKPAWMVSLGMAYL